MLKRILTSAVLLLGTLITQAQDVSLKLPESAVNSMISALVNAKALSFGAIYDGSQTITRYSVRVNSASIDFRPGNVFWLTLGTTVKGNVNLQIFDFDYSMTSTITVSGNIQILDQQPGYKIVAKALHIEDLNGSNSLLEDALRRSANGFLSNFPPIEITGNSDVFPAIASQLFTSPVPSVTTTDTDLIIGYTLLAGPRFITAMNNVNNRIDVGDIEHQEGASWPRTPSPTLFEWNTGDNKQIGSPDEVLTQTNGYNKYFHFYLNDEKQNFITETESRRIGVLVGSQDAKYTARFKKAQPVAASSTGEGISAPGGNFVWDGVSKGTSLNMYEIEDAAQNHTLKSELAGVFGLDWYFQGWSDGSTANPRNLTVTQPVSLTANYKAMMASKSAGWVQSATPYSGNGTKAIVYKTPNGTGEDVWLHTESSAGVKETWVNDVGLPDATMAWTLAALDYNGQKQYYSEMMIDKNVGLNLTIEEYVNGQRTSILLNDYFYLTDLGAASLSLTAKVYVSPYANTTGFPATYSNFLVVVVDGLKVYSKVAVMNNGAVYSWGSWSTFTATSAPVVSTNGKTMYINWIENGNLVGRRYLNTSWGSTYTLYSNSGGNFINFTTAVNSTDDLVLMMTRQNTGSQVKAICFGKRYISGSSAPITVLESSTYGGYSAYSLAAEGTKLLVSVGKTPDGETPMSYYLWKNDGTTWTKETTAFSSSPARLLHNEVDVRPYEFATATTPALYALKTSPVSWGGNGLEKVDQETGLSVVAARLGDTLTWYTTVDPESVDSMLVDTTGLWHIVVKSGEARDILISGLNRFGSAVWVDSSRTVQFTPAEARYTFWVVDPTGNKMRYAKDQADPEEAEFKLEDQVSVFPNPFNPATVFSVTVAEPSRVKLHIYNVIGQQVAEIVNTDLTAGVHDYRLNAGSWASGTYFYRLQIGDKLKSGKIQLVK